jgi:glutamyl-tRNA synthetase
MSKFDKVRVRIAPSPTGDPHVGTAYIALFNYVFAKKMGGDFILRVEDTDRTRARSTSEDMIYSSLKWIGLDWAEGPDKGGEYGPYRQSERKEIYAEHVEILLNNGNAYRDFDSAERSKEQRDEARKNGITKIERVGRDLTEEDIKKHLDAGDEYVVRLKVPMEGSTKFEDSVRGPIEILNKQIDDQVLLKSDGYPTYHLANVVDDHLMKISHVIRAEEWISSTPKHVMLYNAYGWEQPTWVHMPLLRNNDKSKISKRKNPTSLSFYERAGILPEAMLNFLALMGWSYGDDVEKFSLEEMIKKFDLKSLSASEPIFDQKKLNWLNQLYLAKLEENDFVSYIRNQVFNEKYIKALRPIIQERMERFDQFVDKNSFFFNGSLNYEGLPLPPKGKEKPETKKMLKGLAEKLDDLYEWEAEKIQEVMGAHKDELGWKPKDYFMTVRFISTGRKDSPPLAESLEALGRDIVRYRLRDAADSQIFN